MKPEAPEPTAPATRLAGKYMTFKLAREEYGLPILKVRELIGLLDITRVPGAPSFVRGIVNLRGKVIPVVDLRRKFAMEAIEPGRHAVIIVVQIPAPDGSPLTLGALVDEVLEVRDIAEAQVELAPSFGAGGAELEFILGIGKPEGRVVLLLDIDRVLSTAEVGRVLAASASPAST